jgi:hypothetical protein
MSPQPSTIPPHQLSEAQRQALLLAHNMATAALGRDVRVVVPPRFRGIFRGKIIGDTAEHILQHVDDGNKGIIVLHAKNRVEPTTAGRGYPFPLGGAKVLISYTQAKRWRSRPVTREIQRMREPELEQ